MKEIYYSFSELGGGLFFMGLFCSYLMMHAVGEFDMTCSVRLWGPVEYLLVRSITGKLVHIFPAAPPYITE